MPAVPILDMLNVCYFNNESVTRDHFRRIKNATDAGNVHVWRAPSMEAIGYCTWARISAEALRLLVEEGRHPRPGHPAEWREGFICLVDDVQLIGPQHRHCLRQLRRLLAGFRLVVVSRRGRVRLYARNNGRFVPAPLALRSGHAATGASGDA